MLRFLLIILAISALVVLVRRWARRPTPGGDTAGKLTATRMVKCHYCALHISEEDALRSGQQYYCSVEHRQLADSTPDDD